MDCSSPGSSVHGQEYWSGQPFPFPGDLLNSRIEPGSPALKQILYHLSHQGSPIREEESYYIHRYKERILFLFTA